MPLLHIALVDPREDPQGDQANHKDLRSSNLGPLAGQWLVTGWIRAPVIFRSFKGFDPPPFIKSELGFA